MPENNTHSTEDAAEIQERRNYVAYQGIQLEVRAAAEGEESRTIGGYAVKYNTPVVITDRWGERKRDKSVMESRHKPTAWKHEDGYTQI